MELLAKASINRSRYKVKVYVNKMMLTPDKISFESRGLLSAAVFAIGRVCGNCRTTFGP